MINQFESAFNVTIDTDKAVSQKAGGRWGWDHSPGNSIVRISSLPFLKPQTLMAVVDQLDQTLFEKFLKPKVAIATGKLRSGILDPEMDWYETPQPTGE
jgi:hypothetical protein